MAVLRLPSLLLDSALSPDGRVPLADGVEKERERSVGRVEVAFGVAKEGERSGGRVFLADGVA